MGKLIDTKGMDRQAWLALRRGGLGGSDAATLVGLNPYASLTSLYADKMGLLPDADSVPMRIGRALEATVCRMWSERAGKKTRQVHGMYVDEEVAAFRATIDRKVVGENAGLEAKVAGPWTKLDLDGAAPGLYLCQCQWYMMVCGFDRMYLAVLRLSNYQLTQWTIPRDDHMIGALRRAGLAFWQDHVEKGVPPAPDGSDASARAVSALTQTKDGPIRLDAQVEVIQGYEALGKQIEGLKKDRDKLSQQLRLALDGHSLGEGGGYRVRCESQMRESLDAHALKRALPQVYGQFAQVKSVNVLKVAPIKGGEAHVD